LVGNYLLFGLMLASIALLVVAIVLNIRKGRKTGSDLPKVVRKK